MTTRRHIDREAISQKHGKLWARENITVPHTFLAFDRSAPYCQFSHMRQKSRGVRKGTSDTLLLVVGKHIWCEWKQPGKRPDDEQDAFGREIIERGDVWFWTTTVLHYAWELNNLGVPLRSGWQAYAEDHDLRVAAEIQRAEDRVPGVSKPRAPKPSASRVRRVNAIVVRSLPR